jgi:MYXO-CTERM domain-containing protein
MRASKTLSVLAVTAAVLSWARAASAATINVTPADTFAKIESAQPGDEVVIAPGTYKYRVYLTQQAPAGNPIVIRAADPANPPVWDLSGLMVDSAPGSYAAKDRGRGCWQLSGATNIHISGLVIKGCHTADASSAGMRYYSASTGITLKDVVFRNNDNGLTGGTEDSELTAEYCEFDGNGNLAASASSPTHNIYIYGGTFTLRYSYAHDPLQGQNFHIRAKLSTVEYSWFARPKSYAGDLMTDDDFASGAPQAMTLRGNLIDQGAPENSGQIIALYNDAGLSGVSYTMTVVNNTFVVTQPSGYAVHLSNADGTRMSVTMSNNVIAGGKPYLIEDTSKGSVSGTNNWLATGTAPGSLVASVFGASPFKAAASRDFTLAAGSNAIGAASQAVSGLPDKEYFQNETISRAYRLRATVKDVGAFESTTTGAGIGPYGAPPVPTPGSSGASGASGSSGSSSGGASSSSGASGSASGSAPGDGSSSSGGCGCTTSPAPSTALAWLAGLGLLVAHRARRRGKR